MKTIAIIGGNGMLGSDLVQYLGTKFDVTSINRENYNIHKRRLFNIVINANGNSKRFWGNQNPLDDFSASTLTVAQSIFDFPCKLYIYISSPDVYYNHVDPKYTKEDHEIDEKKLSPYGFHKYLSELIVKKYKEKFLILRSSMMLGLNLKKGPIYDIVNNKPLFISLNSEIQLITTQAVAEIIENLLEKSVVGETINIGGREKFNFTKIKKYFDKQIKVSRDAETQIYEMIVEKLRNLYPSLKTSEEYLREFLKHYPH